MALQGFHHGGEIDSLTAGVKQRESLTIKAHDNITARTVYMRHARRRRINPVAKHNIALAYRYAAKRLERSAGLIHHCGMSVKLLLPPRPRHQ